MSHDEISLIECWTIIPRHEASEIHTAALLASKGYDDHAERHRVIAGYGNLSETSRPETAIHPGP